jgi:hypothetical protein
MEPKTILIDNEEYIVVINGKDFLPYEVMEALSELGLAKKLIEDEK